MIGSTIGTKQLGDSDTLQASPGRAAGSSTSIRPAGRETVLVEAVLTADSPAFRAAVEDVARRVSALAVVANLESPYAAGNGGQISTDRHSAIVSFDIRGDADDAVDKIDPVIDAVDAAAAAHPALSIDRVSASAPRKRLDDKFNKDTERAGLLSLPVTIVILVIAFGALVAAGSRCCSRSRR